MIRDHSSLLKSNLLFRLTLVNKIFCLYFIMLIMAFSAEAGARFEFYRGIRQMGMGGAAIAVVNDETALLLNPAGLGKIRDPIITVFDPEVDVGSKTPKIVGLKAVEIVDPQKKLNLINNGHQNKPIYFRFQIFPSFVFPNFGFGIFKKYEISAAVNTIENTYRYDYMDDTSLVLGYSFPFWDGRIKVGFSGRLINRAKIHKIDLNPSVKNLTLQSMIKEGVGVATDVGIILSAPWPWLPTIAAVYHDVGDTHYDMSKGLFFDSTKRPEPSSGTLDTAVALFPIIGKNSRATFTVEYRDVLTANDETDGARRYHTGVEFNFADAIFLRAGYNQNYWTYGLEFSMENYQLQVASYGEEVGTAHNPAEERHYNVKFSYRF